MGMSMFFNPDKYNEVMNGFTDTFNSSKQFDVDALPQRLRWKIAGCQLAFTFTAMTGLWNMYINKRKDNKYKCIDSSVVCLTTLDICSTINSYVVAKYLGYKQDYLAVIVHGVCSVVGLTILFKDYNKT